jgi:hypothetical protein
MGYTGLFISCDIFSIAIQGVASAADLVDKNHLKTGNGSMTGTMVFQIVTLLLIGFLCVGYALSVWKHQNEIGSKAPYLSESFKSKLVLGALVVAYLVTLIRCTYRAAEKSGDWENKIPSDELLYTALDFASVITSLKQVFNYLANFL